MRTVTGVSEDEIQYLLNEVGRYLSDDLQVRRCDVLSAWRGWRPLAKDPHAPPDAPAGKKGSKIFEATRWLLPNVPELLEDMCAMSDGLVRRARLVQAAPALRR